jgi:DDE family transposase
MAVSAAVDAARRGCEPAETRKTAAKPRAGHRPVPGGPRQERQQAPHHRRGPRHPPATILTGGNRNDVAQLVPLIQAIPPIRGERGRPRRRARHRYADRGYDHETYRDQVRAPQITPHIARRGTEHGSALGVHRWIVEGTLALLHWLRRLRIRRGCRDDVHQAFLTLGCAIICRRRLRNTLCSSPY